jgi:hypothetical protein
MHALKLSTVQATARSRVRPRAASATDPGVASPARMLQEELQSRVAARSGSAVWLRVCGLSLSLVTATAVSGACWYFAARGLGRLIGA